MLKRLVILLDTAAPSYCYVDNPSEDSSLISSESLKKAVRFAMLNGLQIQVVTSHNEIPVDLLAILDNVSYGIVGGKGFIDADAIVVESFDEARKFARGRNIILRLPWDDIYSHPDELHWCVRNATRVNLVIKDCDEWREENLESYKAFLNEFIAVVSSEILENHDIQLNVLTDRITLRKPNYCNAGWESVTISPSGDFYICPSFYYDGKESIGNLNDGVKIPNQQLYQIDHAPICQKCDAWQCKRCVWLNRKATGEVSIPGHEQCVMANHERNASRKLLIGLQQHAEYLPDVEIKEINYLDPFDLINQI